MKIKRYVRSYLFFAVVILLVISIGLSVFAFVKIGNKNQEIREKETQLKTTSEFLDYFGLAETKKELFLAIIPENLKDIRFNNKRKTKGFRMKIKTTKKK